MFETAELGRSLGKDEYEALLPELRTALLKAQTELEHAGFPVIVLINGADGAGKIETTNVLHEWFDARYLVTRAYEKPQAEEQELPEFWRYWMWLPAAGRIGIFLGSWYTRPILERVHGKISERELAELALRIFDFEKTLVDEGALLIKLWLHISEGEQERKFHKLEKAEETRYRVTAQAWKNHRRYDKFLRVTARVLRATSTDFAPWTLVEGGDDRYRNVTCAQQILNALTQRLSQPQQRHSVPIAAPQIADPVTILDQLDLSQSLDKAEYETRLPVLQGRLHKLARKLKKQKRSAIFLFEGSDAAGKGGAIRRIVWALDATMYSIIPIAAPSEDERRYHYLWRFWRALPRRGHITIYDRSWYGRVLVERVEGLASEEQWHRAYKEINDFEQELVSGGVILVKFWLQISADEQLQRFQARESEPWKQHKISAEDYRNRDKQHQYEAAASEMIARNSTEIAPFTLIEANDKRFARIKVLETICSALASELD